MACHAGDPRSDFVLEYEWQVGAGWQIGEHPGASPSFDYPENFIVSLCRRPAEAVRPFRYAPAAHAVGVVTIPASPCSGSYLLSTYPNPASDVLKLSIKMTDEARKQQTTAMATGKSKAVKERAYIVQLFGTMGNLVQQKKALGDDIDLSFDVSGLPNGTYFVVVKLDNSDEEPQRATVVVRH